MPIIREWSKLCAICERLVFEADFMRWRTNPQGKKRLCLGLAGFLKKGQRELKYFGCFIREGSKLHTICKPCQKKHSNKKRKEWLEVIKLATL